MVIHLGPAKKRPVQKGRNFVYSMIEQRAFEERLSELQKKRVEPLIKRTTTKARKQIPILANKVKEESRKRKLSVAQIADMMMGEMDRFIIAQLPLPKEVKIKASAAQSYESRLSEVFANAMSKQRVSRHDAITYLEEGLFSYKHLAQPYKAIVPKDAVASLERSLEKLKQSGAKQYLIPLNDAYALKLINAGVVRNILGEEMATVYQKTYSAVKVELTGSIM
jgi:hypothetical protein